MSSALVGFTGFVGSNIKNQMPFDCLYNSKNIQDIEEKEFKLLVFSGAKAEKWLANQNPEKDRDHIESLIANLSRVKGDQFVLISTIDVYKDPRSVNEDSATEYEKNHTYGGQCATGTALSCEDGNPCTAGTCDPVMGCVQTPIGGTCDDGDACTGNGTCRAGVCEAGTAVSCDDDNACTADACVPGIGCQNVPRNDVPCNDNNLCTVDDRCVQGSCVGGAPKNCDDSNACTLDTCGIEKGCVHTATAGGCNDGNACTVGIRVSRVAA